MTERVASFINIGERTNVTGSIRFRKLISDNNYAAALDVARLIAIDASGLEPVILDARHSNRVVSQLELRQSHVVFLR